MVHPLGPRITNVVPLGFVLGVIWLVSSLLSIPFAMYNEVTEFSFLNRKLVRCRVNYPQPEEFYRQASTLLAFLTQYLLPLTIASIAYTFIALSMKKRSKLGAMTKEQIGRILKYVFCNTGNDTGYEPNGTLLNLFSHSQNKSPDNYYARAGAYRSSRRLASSSLFLPVHGLYQQHRPPDTILLFLLLAGHV